MIEANPLLWAWSNLYIIHGYYDVVGHARNYNKQAGLSREDFCASSAGVLVVSLYDSFNQNGMRFIGISRG